MEYKKYKKLKDRIQELEEEVELKKQTINTIQILEERIEWMEFEREYCILDEDRENEYITNLVHKLYGGDYEWNYVGVDMVEIKYKEVFSLDFANNQSKIGIYERNYNKKGSK